MSNNLEDTLKENINECRFLSLQLDELTDVTNTALCIGMWKEIVKK